MTQKSITIKASLDARQAAYFVQTAGKFESEIQVSVDEKRINAKSIMGMMSLGLCAGEEADCPDYCGRQGRSSGSGRAGGSIGIIFLYRAAIITYKKPCRRINGRVDFFLHLCYTVKVTEQTRCTCYGYHRKGPREDHGYPTISVNKKQEVFF